MNFKKTTASSWKKANTQKGKRDGLVDGMFGHVWQNRQGKNHLGDYNPFLFCASDASRPQDVFDGELSIFNEDGGALPFPTLPEPPDGDFVRKLLTKRPSKEQWGACKRQFQACVTGRKKWFSRLHWRFSLFAIFSMCVFCVALLLAESSFVLGLVLIMLVSTLGTTIPVLAWMEDYIVSPEKLAEVDTLSAKNKIFRLVFKKMLRQNPLPKPAGFPDVRTLLEADEVKLERSELQRFATSPSAVAYLRGVAAQNVPLLVNDMSVLERIFLKEIHEKGVSHLSSETVGDDLTPISRNLAGGFA